MPVWGFATVHSSNATGIEVRDRFYGYYTNIDYLKIEEQLNPKPVPYFAPNQLRKRIKDLAWKH